MKRIRKIKHIIFVMILTAIFSCENNVEEEVVTGGEEPCNPNISFAISVKPIIDNNCISCHNGNQFPDLRTYQGISSNAEKVRIQVVNRTMPIGGSLTANEIELIRCWIENGASDN